MDVWNGRRKVGAVVLALVWPMVAGCTIAPKRFHDMSNPAPLVRRGPRRWATGCRRASSCRPCWTG